MGITMLAVLRNRNFLLLWSGGLISMMGSYMLTAALPFYVYSVTGSAMAVGGLIMAFMAPGVLLGSWAGVFVDRLDRRRILVGGNMLAALLVPLMLFTDFFGAVWVLYIVVFLESTVIQFLTPAENALLPTLVDEAYLVPANSLNALNDNLARVAGAALGGVLLAMVGFRNVIIIDAASYAAAAVLIAGISLAPSVAQAAKVVQTRWRSVWREWVDGLSLVVRSSLFRNLFIIVGVGLLGDAVISALFAPFAQEVAGFTAADYGWSLAARGVGGLVGGLVIARVGPMLSPRGMLNGGLFGTGLLLLTVVLVPKLPVVLTLMIVAGPVYMAWIICMQTVLQKETEDRFRGRVFGAYGTISMLVTFVGSGLGGSLADALGIRNLMISATVIYMAAGVTGWMLLRRPLQAVRLGVAED